MTWMHDWGHLQATDAVPWASQWTDNLIASFCMDLASYDGFCWNTSTSQGPLIGSGKRILAECWLGFACHGVSWVRICMDTPSASQLCMKINYHNIRTMSFTLVKLDWVLNPRMSGDNQEGKQTTQWDMHRSDVIPHWVRSSLCTFLRGSCSCPLREGSNSVSDRCHHCAILAGVEDPNLPNSIRSYKLSLSLCYWPNHT